MESTITPSRSALKKLCFGHMKELEKMSNLCFRSKMSFHKVIFKPITTAQRNLHFYDLYAHFRTPLSSHIQIPKKNVPKTLLLQMDFFDHHKRGVTKWGILFNMDSHASATLRHARSYVARTFHSNKSTLRTCTITHIIGKKTLRKNHVRI